MHLRVNGVLREMLIIRTVKELRSLEPQGKRHFVPTMEALHKGHLSLMQEAKNHMAGEDELWVSIFVNPMQFNQTSDFEKYPHTLDADLQACEAAGVDVVFLPSADLMYPAGFSMKVSESSLGDTLCGATRPGHFDGVCTIVSKLFNLVEPRRAYFGEKDFQQLAIIQKMVSDLNFNIEVVPVSTMREADGLAMSSRNLRLSAAERKVAPILYASLEKVKERLESGTPWPEVHQELKERLELADFQIDYAELVQRSTLQPTSALAGDCICAVAAFLGEVRLIDHITISHG